MEIHNFADASSYAYGACSYFRLIDADGNLSCSFLLGKSGLAPIKKVSVPRLELTAAVLAVRVDVIFRQEDLPDEFKAVEKSLTCASKVKEHAQNDVIYHLIKRCSSFYKPKCLVAWIF